MPAGGWRARRLTGGQLDRHIRCPAVGSHLLESVSPRLPGPGGERHSRPGWLWPHPPAPACTPRWRGPFLQRLSHPPGWRLPRPHPQPGRCSLLWEGSGRLRGEPEPNTGQFSTLPRGPCPGPGCGGQARAGQASQGPGWAGAPAGPFAAPVPCPALRPAVPHRLAAFQPGPVGLVIGSGGCCEACIPGRRLLGHLVPGGCGVGDGGC